MSISRNTGVMKSSDQKIAMMLGNTSVFSAPRVPVQSSVRLVLKNDARQINKTRTRKRGNEFLQCRARNAEVSTTHDGPG